MDRPQVLPLGPLERQLSWCVARCQFDVAIDPCVEQGLTFAYDEPATTTTVAAVKAFLTAALK
jgi:hypothetical protein